MNTPKSTEALDRSVEKKFVDLLMTLYIMGVIDEETFKRLRSNTEIEYPIVGIFTRFDIAIRAQNEIRIAWTPRRGHRTRSQRVTVSIIGGQLLLAHRGIDNYADQIPWLDGLLRPILGPLVSIETSEVVSAERATWVLKHLCAYTAYIQQQSPLTWDGPRITEPMPE